MPAVRNPDSTTVYADKNIRTRTIDIQVVRGENTPQVVVAKPLQFMTPEEAGEANHYCTFSISFEDAQQFLDQLWGVGVRPTDDIGSTGQLSAMKEHIASLEKHIADLRKYLDHSMGIVP